MLPRGDKIDWKKHVVWVEWDDRKGIAETVSCFHASMHPDAFKAMQLANRELWKKELSLAGYLKYITNKNKI